MEEVIAGRYRLGAPLGAGGMATVYGARDLRLERPVAVKLVPVAGTDAAGRARFVREARSLAGFSHPNAVAVYDAGEAAGYLFLVMELVEGPSLATRLAEHGRLGIEEAVAVTAAVLAALGAAHAAGIVHRDVKPGNILLGRTGVKLADFGIAKRFGDADLTGAGQFVGTPKYLAPEQAMGEPATSASDLYSVGVVLYEMLAGHPPFGGDTPVAAAIAHRDAPIPDIRRVRPEVPDHVARVVRTAMAKDPAARFTSAGVMATELSRARASVASPERTQVMPMPSPPRRARRWVWAVTAAGLAAGGAGALVLANRDDPPGSAAGLAPGSSVRPATTAAAPTTAPATAAPTTAAPTTAAPATAATTTPAPTTAPATAAPTTPAPAPVTVPAVPQTVEELIAFLEADQDRFGTRTPDFLDKLRDVEQQNGRRESDRAEDLLRRMDRWLDDGELSFDLVPIVMPVLEPIAAGPGNGRDDDDDDD